MPVFKPVFGSVGRAVFSPFEGNFPWDIGTDITDGGIQSLNLATGGIFTRSTEGSYLTSVPTTGTVSFLSWAGVDVRRVEDRGDGLGPLYLSEGSRTNYILQNRALDDAAWFVGSGTGIIPNACASPDGLSLADETIAPSTTYIGEQAHIAPTGAQLVATQWARRVTGTGNGKFGIANGDNSSQASIATALTTTYQRLELQVNTLARNDFDYLACDGRSTWGGSAQALDYASDLQQVEVGYWPSSAIRTLAATVTRGGDLLSYVDGQYPPSLLTNGFRFSFAPDASSAEILSAGGNGFCLLFPGAGSAVYLLVSAGAIKLSVYDPSGLEIQSGALTFSRGQLLTFDISTTGVLIVSGATTGNGTTVGMPITWGTNPDKTIYVGTRPDGTDPSFGRFSALVSK